MGTRRWMGSWPVFRQAAERDWLGLGAAVKSGRSERLAPRIRDADKVVGSVCPYCAVGCGQSIYVKDEKVIQIEGDPDSPVSRGRLCPKGSASLQLTTGDARQYDVLYRRPHGTEWERLDLGASRPPHPAHHGVRQLGRRDAGQRGELPDQEAVHRARRDTDRESGQ